MKLSVLIVDDDETDRYIARRVLKSVGIEAEITECISGDHFVALLDDADRLAKACITPPPPTLILLDINMPRMSGFDVLEDLRSRAAQNPKLNELFVVMMFTSSQNPEDKARATQYEIVRDYLVKPLSREKVTQLLDEHFGIDLSAE